MSAQGVPAPRDLAIKLIDEFGSLLAVLRGSSGRRTRVAGNDADRAIALVQRTMSLALCERLSARPIISNWRVLRDYLHQDMACRTSEICRVLYLDVGKMLIRDEVMSIGTIDEAKVYAREVIARALELGAPSMILVHNHPSGDPTPSRSDIRVTKEIEAAGKPLGVWILDHIVVGATEQVSMRANGLI